MMAIETADFLKELRRVVGQKVRDVVAGEYIGDIADRSRTCFVIFSGTVEERHTSVSGRYTVSRVYQPGHVILPPDLGPESWDQVSRVATANCEVGEIETEAFWAHLSRHPDMMRHFLDQCVQDLGEAMSRLVDANLASVRERLRRELLRRVDQQGGDKSPKIRIRSHDEFAAFLGANRETVSREIARFSRLGAIETSRGHIRVTDVDLLRSSD